MTTCDHCWHDADAHPPPLTRRQCCCWCNTPRTIEWDPSTGDHGPHVPTLPPDALMPPEPEHWMVQHLQKLPRGILDVL